MMTNKDFYGDKLLAALIIVSSCQSMHYYVFGKNCTGKNCKDCEFSNMESIENWLNAEHEEPEPPLLENGDDLSLDDWIMVRNEDCEEWKKRRFMCYYQSLDRPFVTLEGIASWYLGNHECWKQARLPMEGE